MERGPVEMTLVGQGTVVDPTAFGYGDFSFSWGDHICAVFDDPEQQMAVTLSFIVQGLRAAQRCVWVSPQDSGDKFREALARVGGDLPTLEASGQLVILPEIEFYLKDGLFDAERTLALGLALLQEGQRDGWAQMRLTGDASWVRERPIDAERWEAYERQVTERISGAPLVALCQYDRRRFPGSLISTAFRTHPVLILGDRMVENPMFAAEALSAAGQLDIV